MIFWTEPGQATLKIKREPNQMGEGERRKEGGARQSGRELKPVLERKRPKCKHVWIGTQKELNPPTLSRHPLYPDKILLSVRPTSVGPVLPASEYT